MSMKPSSPAITAMSSTPPPAAPLNQTVSLVGPNRQHPVVSREEWLKSRRALLAEEKDLTHHRDRINAKRRELPWVRVEKAYIFDGAEGRVTLSDLFAGRSQLIVQHFMMAPGWKEGCVGCSFYSDHIAGARVHLENHGVSIVAVARAPWPEISAFRRRMGWDFPWYSSYHSDFNYDYHVSFREEDRRRGTIEYNYESRPFQIEELGGTSVFYQDATGAIFHTYSTYSRGDELLLNTYNFLDMTPLGRNENGPSYDLTDWVRHHDRYDERTRPTNCSCGCETKRREP